LDYLNLVLMALDTISHSRPADDPNRPGFESALAELRSTHQSRFLSSSGGAGVSSLPEHSREAVDAEMPVGLANLRNTCYLNSILQYFYSVNAVRDLAVNSDLPPLTPTEANLSNVLRTSNNNPSNSSSESQSDLETGRAFVGHECASFFSSVSFL
jgi:ubiquitin carboxyl-terminal hydrolase 25/28